MSALVRACVRLRVRVCVCICARVCDQVGAPGPDLGSVRCLCLRALARRRHELPASQVVSGHSRSPPRPHPLPKTVSTVNDALHASPRGGSPPPLKCHRALRVAVDTLGRATSCLDVCVMLMCTGGHLHGAVGCSGPRKSFSLTVSGFGVLDCSDGDLGKARGVGVSPS
jgi:hypothetical protein